MQYTEEEILAVRNEYFLLTNRLAERYSVEALASIMTSLAMILFRTMFSDSEYESMMKLIYDERNSVRAIGVDPSKLN